MSRDLADNHGPTLSYARFPGAQTLISKTTFPQSLHLTDAQLIFGPFSGFTVACPVAAKLIAEDVASH